MPLTKLSDHIRLLRWALPLALGLLSVLYQLGPARWVHDAFSHSLHYGIEILFYALVGPAAAFWAVGQVSRWLEEKEQVEHLARTSEQRLASITAASADAILGLDSDGRIESWNHGAELIFGYRANEIQGRPLTDLLAGGEAAGGGSGIPLAGRARSAGWIRPWARDRLPGRPGPCGHRRTDGHAPQSRGRAAPRHVRHPARRHRTSAPRTGDPPPQRQPQRAGGRAHSRAGRESRATGPRECRTAETRPDAVGVRVARLASTARAAHQHARRGRAYRSHLQPKERNLYSDAGHSESTGGSARPSRAGCAERGPHRGRRVGAPPGADFGDAGCATSRGADLRSYG